MLNCLEKSYVEQLYFLKRLPTTNYTILSAHTFAWSMYWIIYLTKAASMPVVSSGFLCHHLR